MRELKDKVKLIGQKGEMEVDALFDTGAVYGYVSKEIADKIGLVIYPEAQDIDLSDRRSVKMKPALGLVEIKGCRKTLYTFVNESPLSDMTLGMWQMEAMGIKIDAQRGYTVSCERPRA